MSRGDSNPFLGTSALTERPHELLYEYNILERTYRHTCNSMVLFAKYWQKTKQTAVATGQGLTRTN